MFMTTLPKIVENKRAAIEALCRRYGVRRLELFGSAATGQFGPEHSDLDFLVEFEQLPSGEFFRCYFDLLEALQELLGRKVDLVSPRAIQNRFMLAAVNRARIPLYAA